MINEQLHSLDVKYYDNNNRLVRVYVPEHEEDELLPVIYMTDGQNLFDKEHALYGCWNTIDCIKEEQKVSGKKAIIVGIHNNTINRPNELTPATIGKVLVPVYKGHGRYYCLIK